MPISINGTSGISGVDGSAGTPSLKGSDTDTGISFATDVIIASTGGTERLRIDSSGRLGIGSASPSAALQVVGGNANQIIIDNGAGNNAAKYTAISSTQFASSAEPEGFCLIGAGATSTSNELRVGGALSELNAATEIVFYTAANTTTRNGSERARIDSSGNFAFNSGYGSSATAYGCRAWVNFNGTGVVAIRASGNVSSITDNGVGNYTVTFTTAMPDANYACLVTGSSVDGGTGNTVADILSTTAPTASSINILQESSNGNNIDGDYMNVVIFR